MSVFCSPDPHTNRNTALNDRCQQHKYTSEDLDVLMADSDEELPQAPLTPRDQGVKRLEHPVQSCEADSARADRAAVKAARRAEVLLSGETPRAAGCVENFQASLIAAGQDTPRASTKDTAQNWERTEPPAKTSAIVDAFRRLRITGIGGSIGYLAAAVHRGSFGLWKRKQLYVEEGKVWDAMDGEDRRLRVLAADTAFTDTKAYEKKVDTLSKIKLLKFDAADTALVVLRARCVTGATKKGDPVVLVGGGSGKLTMAPVGGNYRIELDDDVEGVGVKGQEVKRTRAKIDEKYVWPSQDDFRNSACGQVGVEIRSTAVTLEYLDDFATRLAARRACAETTAYTEVAAEIYDRGHDAFVARCEAATTRTEVLVECYERSLALSCIPKAAITSKRCDLIGDVAGAGYSYQNMKTIADKDKIPEGFTLTQFVPTVMLRRVEEELDEQPPEERLADLFRRRKLHLQREKPKEELVLFSEQMASASRETLNYTLAVPTFNQANWDEAERAFNVAEAARKGKRHAVASARWRLPLDPSMKLAPPANALRNCKKYLVLFDEDDFEELGELVKSLEHGAKSNPHLFPVS